MRVSVGTSPAAAGSKADSISPTSTGTTRLRPSSRASISAPKACGSRSCTAKKDAWASAPALIRCCAGATTPISLSSGMRIIAARWRRRSPPRSPPQGQGSDIKALAVDTTGSTVVPVDEKSAAAGRLLSVVRSPRLARGRRDHRQGAGAQAGGLGLVWRDLFLGMGFRQIAPLAAPSSRKAKRLRYRTGTLRPDGGDALRDHGSLRTSPLDLRHGPQMDVERELGRAAVRRIPHLR